MLAKDQDVSISSQMQACASFTRGATTIVWAACFVVEAHIIVADCRGPVPCRPRVSQPTTTRHVENFYVARFYISVLYVSYPLKKAPDRAKTSGDSLKSVIG